MFYIVLLILFGLLFLLAELLLLPGITVAALLALVSYGAACWIAFSQYGVMTGSVVVGVILLLSLAAVVWSLRDKTWLRFSLQQEIRSSSMPEPAKELQPGARGRALSRLSPMGKVDFGGKVYEAKSTGDYIDPRCEVEVAGFENFNVIVRKIN